MSKFHKMYSKYKDFQNEYLNNEELYESIIKSVKSGNNNFSLYQKYLDHEIDIRWVEEIESCVIPLDNIIRNPRRFIQNIEEIVPIEQARKITNESIRHLAQHTSMIAKVDHDGSVTPNKILNIFKEETFATYENRFIYTLLHNLQYFIDKRLRIIKDAKTQSEYKLNVSNEFNLGNEKIKYELSLSSVDDVDKSKVEIKLDEDTSHMTISQRVERIRTILSDFQSSPLIKSLAGTALVKPPIVKTNVILKNPDFKKAMQTWQFIERYNEAGLIVKVVENHNLPNNDFIEDILTNLALQYVTFAHHNRPSKENIPSNVEAKEFVPVLISRIVEEYIDEYSYDFVKIEKVFVEQLKKVTAKHKENEIKVQKALERVINKEKARLAKEKLANKRKYANFVDDYDDRFYEDKKETIQPNVEEVAPPIISIKQDEKQEAILSVNLKETQQVIEEKEVVEKVIIEEEVVEVVKEEVIEEKVIKEVTKEVDVPPVNVIENVIKNEVFKFEIVKVGEDPSLKVSRRVLRKANKKKRKEKVKANIPVRKVIYRKPNKYK